MVAVAVGSEAAGRGIEPDLAAGDDIEHRSRRNSADHLGNDVRNHILATEPSTCEQAHGDSRIEVRTGNAGTRVGHRYYRQAEGQCHPQEADTEPRESGCQDSATAAPKYQPKGTEKFGEKSFGHRRLQ